MPHRFNSAHTAATTASGANGAFHSRKQSTTTREVRGSRPSRCATHKAKLSTLPPDGSTNATGCAPMAGTPSKNPGTTAARITFGSRKLATSVRNRPSHSDRAASGSRLIARSTSDCGKVGFIRREPDCHTSMSWSSSRPWLSRWVSNSQPRCPHGELAAISLAPGRVASAGRKLVIRSVSARGPSV